MTRYLSLCLLTASAWAAIGDNAPAIPTTIVTTHPVLPHPDAAFLTVLWRGPGGTGTCPSGNLPTRYTSAISSWNPSSPVFSYDARELVLGYLASKNAGCPNATWLQKIKDTSAHLSTWATSDSLASIGAAVMYDWTYSDLDTASRSNFQTFLLSQAGPATTVNSYMSNFYGVSANVFNDVFYGGGGLPPSIMYLAPVIYADDQTTNGPVILRFAMDLFQNYVLPAWRMEFGPQGGGWRESWNGYVSHADGDMMSFVFPWCNIWNHVMGLEGTGNDFFAQNPWLKNWSYWSMRMVRPDWTWDKWGDEAKPYMTSEFDMNGGAPTGHPSGAAMGTLAGLAEAYNDPTLRGWARVVDDNANPDGFDPSGWPYYAADNTSNTTHDRTSLTLVNNMAGIGRISGRTGWNENDTQWAFNWGNVNLWSHEAQDAGAFTIFNRGSLAINGGTYQAGYGAYHHLAYAMQGIAHNIVTVTDPSDVYNTETLPFDNPDGTHIDNQPLPNDGGQRRAGSPYNGICYNSTPNTGQNFGCSTTGGTQALTLDSSMQSLACSGPNNRSNCADKGWIDRSSEIFRKSNLLTYVASPSETAPKYVYAAVDLTPAYNNAYSIIPAGSTTKHRIGTVNRTNRVQHYTRDILQISRGTASYFVVFDDVKSTNPSFTKKWLLHSINQPVLSGNTFTITRADRAWGLPYCSWQLWSALGQITQYSQGGGTCQYQYAGKLYGYNVSPSASTITRVGGPGHEFDVAGTNYSNCSSVGQCGGSDQPGYPAGSGPMGLGNTAAMVPYTPDSGLTYPTAPLEPGGWRIEETPNTSATQDYFINVMLATSNTDTNVVSTAPTVSTSCGSYTGSTACYTVTWKDSSNTCTYTFTHPQHGSGGYLSVSGGGCSVTVAEDIQSNTGGFAVPPNTWVTQPTNGFQVQAFGFDKLAYASNAGKVAGWLGYDFYASDDQQAFLAYDFPSNYWSVLDVGNQGRTEHISAAGHPAGAFDYDPARGVLVDYGGIATNTGRDGRIWQYDLIGQNGWDKPTSSNTGVDLDLSCAWSTLNDYLLCALPGSGTWTWDATSNIWTHQYGLGLGGLPSANLNFASQATRTVDGKIYLFGGCAYGFTSCSNTIFRWDGTVTGWTALSPTGTLPTAAWKIAWAYDRDDDLFLAVNGENGNGLLSQMSAYHPDTNTWEPITPSGALTDGQASWRMVYDSANKVFLYLAASGGAGCYASDACANYNSAKTYFFRYGTNTGPNGGTVTQTNNFAPGGINKTIESGSPTGWASNQSLYPGGSSLYACWSESGARLAQNTATNLFHPYCSQWNGLAWNNFTSATSLEGSAYNWGIVAAGYSTVPWVAWPQEGTSGGTTNLQYGFYSGGPWTTGTVGIGATCGGNSANCYPWNPQYLYSNGTLHLAFLEQDHSALPWKSWAWVKTWNGSSWANKGNALNINPGSAGDFVSSMSLTSDGTNPFIATVEGLLNFELAGTMTNPQVYVQQWNGSAWTQLGSSLNIDTNYGWAQDVAIAYMGGQPYVAWTEKGTTTPGTTVADKSAQLYLKTYSGGSWTQLCSGSLNSDSTFGHAFKPTMTVIGTSLYLGWSEQQNLAKRTQSHVLKWNGTSCSFIGGSLNSDTVNGESQGMVLTAYNSQPTAIFGEVQFGGVRNTYVKTLSGADWSNLQPVACGITLNPASPGQYTATQSAITITATANNCGGGALTWTSSGLPTGLSGCNSVVGSSCTISGTTSSSVGSPFSTAISVSDGGAMNSSINPSITVNPVPSVTQCGGSSTTCPSVTSGNSYSQIVTISGGTSPVACALTGGSLSGSGLTANSNCTITGSASTAALYNLILTPTDANSIAGPGASFTLTINTAAGPPKASIVTGGVCAGCRF